ncbi:hypothetical protein KFE25_009369 [Diacronema lutheri]|uniref:DNA mismatch repair proteins mutS family domain-containing protein n=1 Tax=Diacronema lutheri TaxID=2081491 RepID=A0A8J6CKD2_DIALT|nr:hypothetical protein KFE25_009369 [Diacronema lutheri]
MVGFCTLLLAATAARISISSLEAGTFRALELPLVLDALAARARTDGGRARALALHEDLACDADACAARYQPVADALLLLERRAAKGLALPPLARPERDVSALMRALGIGVASDASFAAPVAAEGAPLDVLRDLSGLLDMLAELAAWGADEAALRAVPHLAAMARAPFCPAHPREGAGTGDARELAALRVALDGAVVPRASVEGCAPDGALPDAPNALAGRDASPSHLLALSSRAFPHIRALRGAVASARAERDACVSRLLQSREFTERVGSGGGGGGGGGSGGGSSGGASAKSPPPRFVSVDGRLGVTMAPVNRSSVGRTLRTSRTRRTIVVEPRALQAATDALVRAAEALAAEEAATAARLCALARQSAPALARASERLARLDVALATARLGYDWGGAIPARIGGHGVLQVPRLRNAALAALQLGGRTRTRAQPPDYGDDSDARAAPRDVVGQDVHLGPSPGAQARREAETAFGAPADRAASMDADADLDEDGEEGWHGPARRSALVLSGPNSSGKTALLKAIGLAAILVRAGVPLPVDGALADERTAAATDATSFSSGAQFAPAARPSAAIDVLRGRALRACGRVDVFSRVLCDLAAETSIEASTSAFVSRLLAHRAILELCAPHLGAPTSADAGADAAPRARDDAATRVDDANADEITAAAAGAFGAPAAPRAFVVPSVLVLLDEFGCAGSEPATSAALGVSILEALLNATSMADARSAEAEGGASARADAPRVRTRIVATTHAHELKAFALADERAASGAMLTQPGSGEPTFRCVTDCDSDASAGGASRAVGHSDALTAAAQWGLPPALVARASHIAGPTGDSLRRLNGLVDAVALELAAARAAREAAQRALEAARHAEARAASAEAAAEAAAARAERAEAEALSRARARAPMPARAAASAHAPSGTVAAMRDDVDGSQIALASSMAPAGLRLLRPADLARHALSVQIVSATSEWDGWCGALQGAARADERKDALAAVSAQPRALVRLCVIPPPPSSRARDAHADVDRVIVDDADDGGVYELVDFALGELATWDVDALVAADDSGFGARAREERASLGEDDAQRRAADAWSALVSEAKTSAAARAAEQGAASSALSRRAAAARLKRNAGRAHAGGRSR